jgi:hypothetical protein
MKTLLRILIGGGAVVSAWFAALAVESATRLMAGLFVQFGADLPTPTIVTIDAVRSYVPWIVAAVSTAAILYLGVRGSGYFLHASAAAAGVVAILVSYAALALALPLMKCGFSWPEWPAAMTEPGTRGDAPGVTPGADASKNALAGSCR